MTPLAVENGVGKLAASAKTGRAELPAREREYGELPSPDLSLPDRKVGRGLFVFARIEQERAEETGPFISNYRFKISD
jgi:hypothetical protein